MMRGHACILHACVILEHLGLVLPSYDLHPSLLLSSKPGLATSLAGPLLRACLPEHESERPDKGLQIGPLWRSLQKQHKTAATSGVL